LTVYIAWEELKPHWLSEETKTNMYISLLSVSQSAQTTRDLMLNETLMILFNVGAIESRQCYCYWYQPTSQSHSHMLTHSKPL